jgi:hypothetical protein
MGAWAGVAEVQGDFALANERARATIAMSTEPATVAQAYGVLIANLTWMDLAQAERLVDEVDEWRARAGIELGGFIKRARGVLALASGQYDRAVAILRETYARRSHLEPWTWSRTDLVIAHLFAGNAAAASDMVADLGQARGWQNYFPAYLGALIAAAQGDPALARVRVRECLAAVRRWKVPLGLVDCVVACAVIAFHAGDIERASELLAAAHTASGGNFRTPSSVAVYRHYAHAVRDGLDAERSRRARAAGATLSLETALARELAETHGHGAG